MRFDLCNSPAPSWLLPTSSLVSVADKTFNCPPREASESLKELDNRLHILPPTKMAEVRLSAPPPRSPARPLPSAPSQTHNGHPLSPQVIEPALRVFVRDSDTRALELVPKAAQSAHLATGVLTLPHEAVNSGLKYEQARAAPSTPSFPPPSSSHTSTHAP